MSEKTEKPTEKRFKDARKKGQVIKSAEITTGLQMATILTYFIFYSQSILIKITALITATINAINQPFKQSIGLIIQLSSNLILNIMTGLGSILIISVIISVIAQVGPLWAPEAVKFSFNKLNVINNIKQIFSVKSLFELAKNIIKVLVLSIVIFYLLKQYSRSFQYLPLCGTSCGLIVTAEIMKWLWGSVLALYFIFTIADYSFQRYSVIKELKMSKEDIKQETKDRDGSPEIKQKQREVQRDIASGNLANNVRKSTVVVRNPTHIAVCLYYQASDTPLPVVLEKAVDKMALHVVNLADKAAVPVVENIPLARALYTQVQSGDPIPEPLFEPVATLLRAVMKISYDEND